MAHNRVTVQPTQRMALTTGLLTSIQLLRADAASLTQQLEDLATENPALVLTRRSGQDWLPRWKSAFAVDANRPEPAAAAQSPMALMLDMVAAMTLPPLEARIAEALVAALEPTGWLGRPLAAIATDARAPLAATEAVLSHLQDRAEPSGLFDRNLAECLRLQARDADELDPIMAALLDRLDLLAKGEIDRLAQEIGTDTDEIRDRAGRLRRYDPKPGAQFEPLAAPVREPDLIAEPGAGGWTVALNRSSLPAVSVSEGRGPDHAAARLMLRMVEGRNATLLAVAQTVLARQTVALEQGPGALEPLTMAKVAKALSLHQSTISRVVAGTSVDTPRGTWWLRALFTQAARRGAPPFCRTAGSAVPPGCRRKPQLSAFRCRPCRPIGRNRRAHRPAHHRQVSPNAETSPAHRRRRPE